jgi:hypothetical protein
MECTICNLEFESENEEQDICPICMDELNETPEPTESAEQQADCEPSEILDTPIKIAVVEGLPSELICEPEQSELVGTLTYDVKIVKETYCHRNPGTNEPVIDILREGEEFGIDTEALGLGASKWGKLFGRAGWVSLDDCKKLA